ncbi:hypothetical protein MPTK1_6g20840 [Marchantia polymorpha subsp. ruderalis]|uniref:Phosphoglycerate mutase n=2 Tax=Marchantia polymorpha TaxID=3197 RepID=A0A176VTR8_MARPO|nr:hypothetical protein AXG93_2752s2160 [Marchantia polymorpha subsp. ruderalis]PTQ33227.1 hypothetical protein MARPO_0091s0071 [Marchantia polymorpha]BBN15591.1 hypothetical protein Mp_6g20840 [Marchantia polymorpha subsp. ruderalis]|eukprot:PTQ33227.1 hypothetical protein MARPO_0091s0071 [Marchantia polymorpha]
MAELLLRGVASCRGSLCRSPLDVHVQIENPSNRRHFVSPRASDTVKDDEVKSQPRWPQRVCAVVAATLLTLTPQSSYSKPFPWLEMVTVGPASANGLLQMPPRELKNRYFLVRSGLSNYESMGLINTNPVSKTSVDNGLSPEGLRQAEKAAHQLKDIGACEDSCWIWPSITMRAYQSAELIAYINNITYSRIVPEYSFLDARGLGAYEGRKLSTVDEIYAGDSESVMVKPPPFTDGTPNESVTDVLVRLTQLMSILETQYYGDAVVIVSPDSDNLSILQAALTGQDLRRHSSLAFAPGEVRRIDASDLPAPRPLFSGQLKCATSNCK